jgi:predicted aspartyl protease
MTGSVDAYGRATVPVRVKHSIADTEITVEAWIDTGFTDALMLTAEQIATLGLSPASTVTAGFADGS